MPRPAALIFAYNTSGGLLSSVVDIFRAMFAPRTFPCRLCELTFTPLGLKKPWWEHLKSLNIPLVFVYKDELKKKYGINNVDLPAVFKPGGDRLQLLIDKDEINRCRDVDGLIRLVDRIVG